MDQLLLSGKEGVGLAEFILGELDDETLDHVDVVREFADASGNANEPITLCALLTFSGVAVVTVGRLVERWMELHATERQIDLVADVYAESPEAGKAARDIALAGIKVTAHRQPLDPTRISKAKVGK
jgi:hypothetical protein